MLDTYMDPSLLNATLSAIVTDGGFTVEPRFNPGSELPTDFAVIVVRF